MKVIEAFCCLSGQSTYVVGEEVNISKQHASVNDINTNAREPRLSVKCYATMPPVETIPMPKAICVRFMSIWFDGKAILCTGYKTNSDRLDGWF